jgi:hypothetical protein
LFQKPYWPIDKENKQNSCKILYLLFVIKPLRRLILESIRMQIVKNGFEILTLYIFSKEDKISSCKANLIDGQMVRK